MLRLLGVPVQFIGNKRIAIFIALVAALCGAQTPALRGQKPAGESVNDVLLKAGMVADNIEVAITGHITDDVNFRRTKQLPEDRRDLPTPLVKKDGSFEFDWTPGQHARYLMESLRQGIHALQSVEKPKGFDVITLTGAREYWPKVRDIFCHENPGIRYYDLDGFEQYCPEK
jgi:hypothetical protein